MRYECDLAEVIERLRSAHEAAAQLQITVTEDRPDGPRDNFVLTRFEERCLDAQGWLQETQAALVPVTPGPAAPNVSAVARALLACQSPFDRCRDVLLRDITGGAALGDVVATCRGRGPDWMAWIRTAVAAATALMTELDAVRSPLHNCWVHVLDELASSTDASDQGPDGDRQNRTKGTT